MRDNKVLLIEAENIEQELAAFIIFLKSKLSSDFFEIIVTGDNLILQENVQNVGEFCGICKNIAMYVGEIGISTVVKLKIKLDKKCASYIGILYAIYQLKKDLEVICIDYKNMNLATEDDVTKMTMILKEKAYLVEVNNCFFLFLL